MKTLMIFAVAVTLTAQNPPRPPGPPPSLDAIGEYLALSDSQASQLKQMMRSRAEGNRARFQEMNAKRRQVDEMLRQGTSDAASLGRLMLEVESYRKQVRTADEGFFTEAASVLNETQRAKLKALEDAARLLPAVHEARALGLLKGPEGAPRNGPLLMRRPGPPTRERQ
ncbi:MAG: periplasmic heavy metal sensor [Bryobacterales bacterium]|nr:periplasmic heavy metal sensor [Bryobacterales bacterium]